MLTCKVKNDLESSREECKVLMERLLLSEESAELVNCQRFSTIFSLLTKYFFIFNVFIPTCLL